MNYEEMKPIIKLRNVVKAYGDTQVVRSISLDIYEGEFLTLLGSSGCGKTTTLRMIAGFESTTEGEIYLGDKDMAGEPPYARDVNTVFQSYALFPHMNVFDNVAFGLVEKKIKKAEIKKRVADILELVQLSAFAKRKPDKMSGGQKQRVAIARALINNPKVLLLDEPLGALDLKLRKQMQLELKHLQQKLGITFVYVTHDQEEALTMSDRIAIMNNGVIEQIGTAQEIYEHPSTKFVANFIGESNILEAYVTDIQGEHLELTLENGVVKANAQGFVQDEMVYASVRPENMKYSLEPQGGFTLQGKVTEHIYTGSVIKTTVELFNSQLIKINNHPENPLIPIGTIVYLYWLEGKCVVLHTKEDQLYDVIEDAVLTFKGGG
ncbi:MAG: ABC transporter ATP-binding protein [Lachnospiraceae bacterium]